MKLSLIGAGVTGAAAMKAQWNRAERLIQNLITWSWLTSDTIRIQFTNMFRDAGYSEAISNRIGVAMKQLVEWLCNHPEWFE